MSKDNDRVISRRSDGKWQNKRTGASRPAGVHATQKDAVDQAERMLRKSGGGELITMGKDGKIRSKDTIAPGNDPNPPKDKEH